MLGNSSVVCTVVKVLGNLFLRILLKIPDAKIWDSDESLPSVINWLVNVSLGENLILEYPWVL